MAKKQSRWPCNLTSHTSIITREPHQLTKYYHHVLTPSPFPLALVPQPLPSSFHDSFSLRCFKDQQHIEGNVFHTANIACVTVQLLVNNDNNNSNNSVCIHVWLSLVADSLLT